LHGPHARFDNIRDEELRREEGEGGKRKKKRKKKKKKKASSIHSSPSITFLAPSAHTEGRAQEREEKEGGGEEKREKTGVSVQRGGPDLLIDGRQMGGRGKGERKEEREKEKKGKSAYHSISFLF